MIIFFFPLQKNSLWRYILFCSALRENIFYVFDILPSSGRCSSVSDSWLNRFDGKVFNAHLNLLSMNTLPHPLKFTDEWIFTGFLESKHIWPQGILAWSRFNCKMTMSSSWSSDSISLAVISACRHYSNRKPSHLCYPFHDLFSAWKSQVPISCDTNTKQKPFLQKD